MHEEVDFGRRISVLVIVGVMPLEHVLDLIQYLSEQGATKHNVSLADWSGDGFMVGLNKVYDDH